MIVREALSQARDVLSVSSSQVEGDAALESEVLLRHVLKVNRAQLYLEFDRELGEGEYQAFGNLIKRRLNHEPTAYITGHREFYGLDFYVNPAVLIPRPESELLVEKALALAQNRPVSTIADIGTGSGAIAISLALNLPQTKVYAVDISDSALAVARVNCQKHKVTDRVHLLEGNMLDSLPEPVDLIVANLPYVRELELCQVNTAGFEPLLALDGGQDGLKKIRQLCLQAGAKLQPGSCLLLEIGEGQKEALVSFLSLLFPSARIEVAPDLGGVDRMVSVIT